MILLIFRENDSFFLYVYKMGHYSFLFIHVYVYIFGVWLKTTGMYCLTVLMAIKLESRCQQVGW
jgi:hypothetical protein